MPIIVAGTLRTASGLGESARLCHDALKAAGLPVLGIDLTTALMQPEDSPHFGFSDGRSVCGTGTVILHVNAPIMPLALLRLGTRFLRQKRIIGYWAWELPEVPPEWSLGTPCVHEIWVPSAFTAEAVRPMAGLRPIHVVPHPVALHAPRASRVARTAKDPFTVLNIFNAASSCARKNPLASIAAFRRAFGDDPTTQLVIKTSNLHTFPAGASQLRACCRTANNIMMIDRILSASEIDALYVKADCVISLHRSEGFGLTIAEAMLRSLPVVATDWSGNVDFLDSKTGVPICYRLIPAEDAQGTYHYPKMVWADADVEAAAEALCRLRADPALRQKLGDAALQFGARAWSAANYASAVRQHLGLVNL